VSDNADSSHGVGDGISAPAGSPTARPCHPYSILFCMKPDLYTKTVLPIIAILLSVIVVKPLIGPSTKTA
jgi:hypothetical protein